MELGYILRRAWQITWEHKRLWLFGFLVSLGVTGTRIGVSSSQWELAVYELPPEMQQPIVAFINDPSFATVAVVFTVLGFVASVGVSLLSNLGRAGLVNQTRAVDKIRLIKRLGHLPEEIMTQVNQALMLHYDLE